MKMVKIISVFIFGLLVLNSCKKSIGNDKNINLNSESQRDSNNLKLQDTVDVDKYELLFFHPSEEEFDKLLQKYGEGLNEVDSDYAYYANKVFDSISKTDSKVKIITERIIKLTLRNGIKYIDRIKNDDGHYGVIFNAPNCDPQIEFGIMTDEEMFQVLNAYNKNCN